MAKFEDGIVFLNSKEEEVDLETKLNSIEQSIEQTIEGVQDGTIVAMNAKNVGSTIAGKAITDIFETNGTTVKNATNATNADHATSADNASHATSADSATKATQDSNGNNIASTYATQSALTSGLDGKANTSGTYSNLIAKGNQYDATCDLKKDGGTLSSFYVSRFKEVADQIRQGAVAGFSYINNNTFTAATGMPTGHFYSDGEWDLNCRIYDVTGVILTVAFHYSTSNNTVTYGFADGTGADGTFSIFCVSVL